MSRLISSTTYVYCVGFRYVIRTQLQANAHHAGTLTEVGITSVGYDLSNGGTVTFWLDFILVFVNRPRQSVSVIAVFHRHPSAQRCQY